MEAAFSKHTHFWKPSQIFSFFFLQMTSKYFRLLKHFRDPGITDHSALIKPAKNLPLTIKQVGWGRNPQLSSFRWELTFLRSSGGGGSHTHKENAALCNTLYNWWDPAKGKCRTFKSLVEKTYLHMYPPTIGSWCDKEVNIAPWHFPSISVKCVNRGALAFFRKVLQQSFITSSKQIRLSQCNSFSEKHGYRKELSWLLHCKYICFCSALTCTGPCQI